MGIAGVYSLVIVFGLMARWGKGIERGTARAETALIQMEDYRKEGVRAFLEDGRVTTKYIIKAAYDTKNAPKHHDPKKCDLCRKNDEAEKRQILVSFVPGKERFVATRFGESDWRITSMESAKHKYDEEGPYVITYTVSGEEAYQRVTGAETAKDRLLILVQASKEPSKIIQDIKVFRSYRIDPEELEGRK